MITVIAGCVLAIAAVVAILATRRPLLALGSGLLCLGVTVAGFAFISFGPRDYMVRYPGLATIAHPYLLALYLLVTLVAGAGLVLGAVSRLVVNFVSRRTGRSGVD